MRCIPILGLTSQPWVKAKNCLSGLEAHTPGLPSGDGAFRLGTTTATASRRERLPQLAAQEAQEP